MSRLRAPALVCFVAGGLGCSSTQQLARPATIPQLQAQVMDVAGPHALTPAYQRITLLHASPAAAEAPASPPLEWSQDAITIASNEGPRGLSIDEIEGFAVRRPDLGIIDGGVIGLLAGAAVGGAIGYAQGDSSCTSSSEPFCDLFDWSAEEKALLAGAAGGVIGAVAGLIVGGIVGHTTRYVFVPSRSK